jgi:hypothetical protein
MSRSSWNFAAAVPVVDLRRLARQQVRSPARNHRNVKTILDRHELVRQSIVRPAMHPRRSRPTILASRLSSFSRRVAGGPTRARAGTRAGAGSSAGRRSARCRGRASRRVGAAKDATLQLRETLVGRATTFGREERIRLHELQLAWLRSVRLVEPSPSRRLSRRRSGG